MKNESTPKIAYLILAHQDPDHLLRLTKVIKDRSRVFIHLDKKTDINSYLHIANNSSVKFIPKRHKVYWGGLSMVNATLELIKSALASGENYSHLVLLSGSDYPIKPIKDFYTFLSNNQDKQFIKFIDVSKSPLPSARRVTDYWFLDPLQPFVNDRFLTRFLEKILHTLKIKRKTTDDIFPVWGNGNWAITPRCASFIVKYIKQNPNFYRFYKYAHCVDEQVFHTIIANSPFLNDAEGAYEDFSRPFEFSNVTLNFMGRVFDKDDYQFLEDLNLGRKPTIKRLSKGMADRDVCRDSLDYHSYFFARKFTTERSSELLDLIDKNFFE